MPYTKQQENFFRLLTLICVHGTHICRQLLQKCINTTSPKFEEFINDHQHEIYHFYNRNHCCQCDEKTILPKQTFLDKTQMLIIFNKDSNRLDKHEKRKKRELCCLKANEEVNLEALDLTFVGFFLFNFCKNLVWKIYLPYDEENFESFMNENVHKVYHLAHKKVCCCKCNSDRDIPEQQITEDKFGILFEIVNTACQSECSCQYKIKKNITFSSLVDGDNTLFTELTWCLCLNHPKSINSIRNKIMHKTNGGIIDDEFKEFWDITENNILGIAKALDLHDDYAKQLQELKKECNNTYCETALVEWLEKNEHVTEYMLQTIYNSKGEHKIWAIVECLNKLTIRGCVDDIDIEDKFPEITKAVIKKYTPEISYEHLSDQTLEIRFMIPIPVTNTLRDLCITDSVDNGSNEDSVDNGSNEDEPHDKFGCGKCKTIFTKLDEYLKHRHDKNICSIMREKKVTENPRKRRFCQIKVTNVGNKWTTEVKKKFKREPDLFDTEDTCVDHMETSCLIVWAESSQSEEEITDKAERCIKFTENMFKKCPLDSLETTKVDVTVTFSELFEESESDNDDNLECGVCGHKCHAINSFLVHKKECVRNRKRRREHEQYESKGDDKLVQKSKKIKIDGISQEEENFLRIAVLITRVATDAVRIVFDREFQGGALKGTLIEDPEALDDLRRKRIILPFQWQMIFPESGQASSYSLSLKIMACLIQFLLTRYIDYLLPTNPKDVSIEADLSRVLYYRRVIAGSTDTKLTKEEMDEYWMVISGAIVRLGGKEFRHKCNELKVIKFNDNYIEMLTEIKEIAKKDNSYPQGFKRLLDYMFYIGPNEASPRTATFISQEEANFLLIAHLLLKIAPPAIRIIFDEEFHPDVLQSELRKRYNELNKLRSNGCLNPAQWDKLFPKRGKPKSTAFDLSLMIFLIRKYTDIRVSNQLPVAKKRKGTDISTVMYYWKEIAGEQDCVLSNQTFEEYWTAITDAIERIGGTHFEKRCIELKNQTLKQNNMEISNAVKYMCTSHVPALKDNN